MSDPNPLELYSLMRAEIQALKLMTLSWGIGNTLLIIIVGGFLFAQINSHTSIPGHPWVTEEMRMWRAETGVAPSDVLRAVHDLRDELSPLTTPVTEDE